MENGLQKVASNPISKSEIISNKKKETPNGVSFFILSMKNPLSFFERIYILLYRILNKNKIKKEEAQGDDSISLGYINYGEKIIN